MSATPDSILKTASETIAQQSKERDTTQHSPEPLSQQHLRALPIRNNVMSGTYDPRQEMPNVRTGANDPRQEMPNVRTGANDHKLYQSIG